MSGDSGKMPEFVQIGPRAKDITGQRFGRLIALGPVDHNNFGRLKWLCRCDCGNETITNGESLRRGATQSCGCLGKENAKKSNTKHGLRRHRLYRIWYAMIQRCTNPNDGAWKNYGQRGISVCGEWRVSFRSFFDHVSALPNCNRKGYSIDRINNDGNYEPGNVKWSTAKEQRHNRRDARRTEK